MSLLNKQVFTPASKNELFVNCLHNGKFACTFSIQSKDFDSSNSFLDLMNFCVPRDNKNFPFNNAENHRVNNLTNFLRF